MPRPDRIFSRHSFPREVEDLAEFLDGLRFIVAAEISRENGRTDLDVRPISTSLAPPVFRGASAALIVEWQVFPTFFDAPVEPVPGGSDGDVRPDVEIPGFRELIELHTRAFDEALPYSNCPRVPASTFTTGSEGSVRYEAPCPSCGEPCEWVAYAYPPVPGDCPCLHTGA